MAIAITLSLISCGNNNETTTPSEPEPAPAFEEPVTPPEPSKPDFFEAGHTYVGRSVDNNNVSSKHTVGLFENGKLSWLEVRDVFGSEVHRYYEGTWSWKSQYSNGTEYRWVEFKGSYWDEMKRTTVSMTLFSDEDGHVYHPWGRTGAKALQDGDYDFTLTKD